MMKMKKHALLLLVICLITAAATGTAESITFNGKVEASETREVYAPVSGTAEQVNVREGETVTADTVIARLRTTKVYAPENGTVTSVYGQPGDDAEKVASTYGAVMYLEGETVFYITATSEGAAEVKDNYIVHSGETMYLVSRNHTTNKGQGLVTEVTENSFTIRVSSGKFYVGDSIDIYRNSEYTPTSRVGRGTISRVPPDAVTGSGSIVSYAVQAGDRVTRGQLLFETIQGAFDGLEMTGTEITAGVDGVIASLNVSQGSAVTKDSVVAVIYPQDAVWVAASVSEGDLKDVAAGQKVTVELDWNQDMGVTYEGTVVMVSAVSSSGSDSASYPVYITFTPDENTRFGMTAMITTLSEDSDEEETEETEEAEDTDEENDTEKKAAERHAVPEEGSEPEDTFDDRESRRGPRSGNGERPEMPENFVPGDN